MFVGHYSASFAIKAAKPKIPLWTLFLAVQAVDIGWGTLMLLGVEKARYVKGFTEPFHSISITCPTRTACWQR